MTTNKVKLFIIFIEHRLVERQQIFHFQRKFVILQLILTICTLVLQAYLTKPFTVNTTKEGELTFIDMFYFIVITATTVGFGDFNLDYEYYMRTLNSPNKQEAIVQSIKFIIASVNFYFVMAMSASLINTLVSLESRPCKVNNKVKVTENQRRLALKDM